jgi:hypothetical protein
MENLFVYKLSKTNYENLDADITFTTTPNLPLISLGYHNYIERTGTTYKTITSQIESTNDFYNIVLPYDSNTANYDDNIINKTKEFLKIDKDVDNNLLIIWEILFLFDLINKKDISCLSLENEDFNIGIKQYISKLTDIKKQKINTIKLKDKSKSNADLIVCNFSHDEEYKNYIILLQQLLISLKYQNSKGSLVIKLSGTYTLQTLKLIYILISFYEESYIYKPLLSKASSSDKYLICKNFKNKDDKLSYNIEKIIVSYKDKYIFDIFLNLILPKEFINTFKFINIKLGNYFQIVLNDIIVYIKENNYFGDKYHSYKKKQIENSVFWVTNFLQNKNKEDLIKSFKLLLEKYNMEQTNFISNLIK